ncbi:MAG: hypothetical protein D6748_04375 [Calditrichaeota bacterium]|nr:MAG: hypothetical protein D6748_04375 [Calditrichota bacterium]
MAADENVRIHQDMVFKLSPRRSPSEVKLRSMEWAIVTQLNGEKSVAQIAEILALSPEETEEMFTRLMEAGLLELVKMPEKNSFVSAEFFEEIEYQFTYFVGPVASVLIEDVLGELKRSRNNIEKKQLPLFIELLSLEISDEDKRYQFQKIMLKKLKEELS